MSKIAGRFIKFYTGSTPVVVNCLTDVNLSMSKDEIDTSCNDGTTGWGSSIGGLKKATVTATGYVITNETNGYQALFAAFNNDEQISFKISSEQAGDAFESGVGTLVGLNKKGSVNGAMTFDFTLSVNSPITLTVIS